MKLTTLFAIMCTATAFTIPMKADVKLEALRDHINAAQKLWRAELPKVNRSSSIMDRKYAKVPEHVPVVKNVLASIPASFDARTAWSQCPSIGAIGESANCASSWAFGAVGAMSDRVCIESGGKVEVTLSAGDLLSCCGYACGSGCEGGYPYQAWQYWNQLGICTGGGYYENTFCKPYPIQPCAPYTDSNGVVHTHDCGVDDASTPVCYKSCTNTAYKTPYTNDKYYGKSVYKVWSDVDSIKTEIMTNGPVEAAFILYEDFYLYSSGIYKHVSGEALGAHAVKLIGWGSESGTPYWLAANSWDTLWGESGYFRILLGTDECEIEDGIVAGLAKL